MTVKCDCGYEPKNYGDLLRHLTLMTEKGSKENHGASVTEWNLELCKLCKMPLNEATAYEDKDEVIICPECKNSRSKADLKFHEIDFYDHKKMDLRNQPIPQDNICQKCGGVGLVDWNGKDIGLKCNQCENFWVNK